MRASVKPIGAQRRRYTTRFPVLARWRKNVIIIINETGTGSFGLFGDCPGFGTRNSAAGGGQTVAAHHRLPPLRRRLRQNLLAAELIWGLGSGVSALGFGERPRLIFPEPRRQAPEANSLLRHGILGLHRSENLRPGQSRGRLVSRRDAARVGD